MCARAGEGLDLCTCALSPSPYPIYGLSAAVPCGAQFVPLRISEGERACCFTWKVVVNGEDGPQGISFYECQDDGKIGFIRDSTLHADSRCDSH